MTLVDDSDHEFKIESKLESRIHFRFDLSHDPERNLEWLVSVRGSLCDVHNAVKVGRGREREKILCSTVILTLFS